MPKKYPMYHNFETLSDLWSEDYELLNLYKKGGLHPVKLGFKFGKINRYSVVHKLGHSDKSTLWLARDSRAKRYVALDIMVSDLADGAYRNLLAISKLTASTSDHPGKEYIAAAIDNFQITGPNGSHACFVYPTFGLDLAWRAVLFCGADRPAPGEVFSRRLSVEVKLKLARQAVEGLAWLHENGIGHGDFRTGNILHQFGDLGEMKQAELLDLLGEPDTLKFKLGYANKPLEPGQPSHIVQRVDPFDVPDQFLKDKIYISRLHWSFDIHNPPKGAPGLMVVGYASPELLFEDRVEAASDVWALACTLYEIRTGHRLFYESELDNPGDVAGFWFHFLGYIPEKWWKRYRQLGGRAGSYCEYTFQDLLRDPDVYNGGGKPSDLSEEEVETFADLLQKMLRYEAEERITLPEVMRHPWMTSQFT